MEDFLLQYENDCFFNGNFELRLHLGEECIYKERLSKKSKIILVVNNFFQTIISSNNMNFITTSEWYRIMS